MKKIENEMPSIQKFKNEIKGMKIVSFLGGREVRKQFQDVQKQFNNLLMQIELFNERFSDKGWIVYDSISLTLIEKANQVYDEKGIEEAEKVLTTYYSTEIEKNLFMLKNCEELALRYNLILRAFEDHKEGRYHASIPVFLMIIDGAVNDYTKRKGFFAEDTDVSAWDCLVGCSDGLAKLKNIYCQRRKKTNIEMIDVPYRNGILHGRDLNYDNILVSSKCLVLIFAIHDWMMNKKNEEIRKDNFQKDQEVPTWNELAKKLQKNNEDKITIKEWKPRKVIIGKDIPESGEYEEYDSYDYVKKVIKVFECWSKQNYGRLSILLKDLFRYEQSEKVRPKLCRELFQNKALISYKLLEVEERAISLRRVLIEVEWETNGKSKVGELEFGLVYQRGDGQGLIPDDENGDWIIKPWKVQALYQI
ncbi:hypothetical protein [Marinisporobacter balticus]|uniref:hypothetical protein n=1 Tax=Marinisporobacter balticus TaxID=2018667 RepID=UPI001052BD14|nr:hypothetical protein [Marinisporobacter balticus]